MDYKSKYKDLMEKVEAVKKDPRIGLKKGTYYNGYVQTGIRDALEYITTDESEDERIRKFLVKHVSEWIGCIEHDLKISSKDVESEEELAMFKAGLAYLEKQKDEAQKQFNLGVQAGREEVLYEMEKEQNAPGYKTDDYFCERCQQNAFNAGKEAGLKEQKPNQSEDEKEYVRTLKSLISDFLRGKDEIDRGYYQKIYDWLDGRHIEQKSAEWSEEDEAAFGDLMWCIEQAMKSAKDENDMGNVWFAENWVKNRLKSLRPQPHWKPSEEQMKCLEDCVNKARDIYNVCNVYTSRYDAYPTLKSLYNDLQQLL